MVRSAIIISLLFLVAGIPYFVDFDAPGGVESADIRKVIQSDCHLSQASCKVLVDDDLTLTFDLKPKTLPVMEPVFLSIAGLSGSLKFHKAWFEGRDMNMGKHFLLPVNEDNSDIPDLTVLKGLIPVCHIDSSMIWRLVVEFQYKEGVIQLYFEQGASDVQLSGGE